MTTLTLPSPSAAPLFISPLFEGGEVGGGIKGGGILYFTQIRAIFDFLALIPW